MKTLLGLIGSPRRLGNSELMVKEIFRQLPEAWELKLLRLPALDIKPCKGCYQCLFGKKRCVQKDDFQFVLDALAKADAYVVATPTYLFGANASLKQFLDRGLSFGGRLDELWAKPAVGVITAGFTGLEGYAKLMVDSFIKFSMADHRGSEVVYAALPGEVFLREEGRVAAKRLANALINGREQPGEDTLAPRCGLCGGDTFRFLDDRRVRCMLCSSDGTYNWNNGVLEVTTIRGNHPIFLTYEDAQSHFAFLQGMKQDFLAKREQLKAVVKEYAEIGTWIAPEKADG